MRLVAEYRFAEKFPRTNRRDRIAVRIEEINLSGFHDVGFATRFAFAENIRTGRELEEKIFRAAHLLRLARGNAARGDYADRCAPPARQTAVHDS